MLAEPPPELRFRRRIRLVPAIREVWRSRELIRTLAERQLRARYKQAVLGFGWAILTPLVLMVVFTVFFQPVADVDTGGVPYPLFAYLGILPWTFFSSSVSEGGQSLVQNMPILNKVYCPREVFPMSSIAVAGVDSSIALLVLLGLFIVESVRAQPDFGLGTRHRPGPTHLHTRDDADRLALCSSICVISDTCCRSCFNWDCS